MNRAAVKKNSCLPSADRVIFDVPGQTIFECFFYYTIFFSTIKIEENRTCYIGMDGIWGRWIENFLKKNVKKIIYRLAESILIG